MDEGRERTKGAVHDCVCQTKWPRVAVFFSDHSLTASRPWINPGPKASLDKSPHLVNNISILLWSLFGVCFKMERERSSNRRPVALLSNRGQVARDLRLAGPWAARQVSLSLPYGLKSVSLPFSVYLKRFHWDQRTRPNFDLTRNVMETPEMGCFSKCGFKVHSSQPMVLNI